MNGSGGSTSQTKRNREGSSWRVLQSSREWKTLDKANLKFTVEWVVRQLLLKGADQAAEVVEAMKAAASLDYWHDGAVEASHQLQEHQHQLPEQVLSSYKARNKNV